MENIPSKSVILKTKISVWIGVGVLSLAVAAVVLSNLSSPGPKVTSGGQIGLKFYISNSDPAYNFNTDKETDAGIQGVIFADFAATSSQPVILRQLSFAIGASGNQAAFAQVRNWLLYQVNRNSDEESEQLIGKVNLAQGGKITIGNLSVNLNPSASVFLRLKGDIGKKSPSGEIGLKISEANIVLPSGPAGSKPKILTADIGSGFSGAKITVNGLDKIASISVTSPVAGSKNQGTLSIGWTAANYPTDASVNIFLMRKKEVIKDVFLDESVEIVDFGVVNNGSKIWTIPSSVEVSDGYFVKITCGLDGDFAHGCQDGDSGVFSIIK